jgi:putative membrane protein
MKVLLNILLTGIAVAIADYVIPGVALNSFVTALVAGVILGLVNALIRPIVLVLTLPINVLTFGLFTFVINALMIMLVAAVVPGFAVGGFWSALLFSVIVSLLKMMFNAYEREPAR